MKNFIGVCKWRLRVRSAMIWTVSKSAMAGVLPILLFVGCKSSDDDTLKILSFNDFHGQYVADYDIAGAARLVSAIEQQKNAVVLCGGDNFSGTYFSRVTNNYLGNELYKRCGVKYSCIGNHEFDWGIDTLIYFATKGNITYLSANIFTDSTMTVRPYWLKPYVIEQHKLSSGRDVKVAIIGLTTIKTKTSTKTSGTKTTFFANPYPATREIMELLKDSADVYIILAHIGMSMKDGQPTFDMGENADSLPYIKGVNAIIAAHSHNVVMGYINEVPVVEAGCYGNYIGVIRLDLNAHTSAVEILPTAGAKPNGDMEKSVEKIIADPRFNLSETLAVAEQEIPYDYTSKAQESTELGAMVATAYSDKFKELALDAAGSKIIIGLSNFGAIRVPLEKGNITMVKAGNVLPFGGELQAYEVTGKELKAFFNYGIFGTAAEKRGMLQSHNLEITVKDGSVAQIRYISPDSDFGGNGGGAPARDNARVIADNDRVIIVAESFLLTGGDGYPKINTRPIEAFKSIPSEKKDPTIAFADYLRSKKNIWLNTAVKCKIL
ncbi:MAG: 5'-nucleotidase C-terminal domain-containing protein [Bacteroidales bacterium]|nr:5'-nucleotidase C-terminal domain-containing protein [Bacteroidales bacterium]